MKKNSGFILITVLLLLSIISLLSLTQTGLSHTYFKIFNARLEQSQDFRYLEWVVNRLVHDKNKYWQTACKISALEINQIPELLKHKSGCVFSYQNKSYQFIIEEIGAIPCLEIENEQQVYTSWQWRVTVMAANSPERFMQARVSELGAYQPCYKKSKNINKGIISWRYF